MAIPCADVVAFLDHHYGAATVLLTLALICVTAYYATQNRRMVGEMAKARELSVMPKLALEFHRLGPTVVTVAIKNVGPGAALNLDVVMAFEPLEAASLHEQPWRQNVLASGEQRDFMPPGGLNGNIDTLPATYRAVTLRGTMRDALGKLHHVAERFDDLPAWRAVLSEARQRWVAADPEHRLAEELGQKFQPLIQDVTRQINEAARAAWNLSAPPPQTDESPLE